MTPQELKNSILQMAIQGKLVEQRPEEGTAKELYQQIQNEKKHLKIKDNKKVVPINEEDLPFDIPDSWKWVVFGDIADYHMGKTPPRAEAEWWNEDIPWVSIADMPEGGHISYTKEKISQIALKEKFGGVMSKAGTMLMSFKLTVGRVSILDVDAVHNEAIISIFPFCNNEGTMQNYLFEILPLITQFGDSKNAIKGRTLNATSISNLLIPLPPLAEQKRIVAKIEELLPLIDRYEAAWTKLEAFNKRFPEDMQKSILQQAIHGKLVEQRPEEGTGEELYQQIQAEKQRLIKEKKIKKDKPLPEITDDEKPFDIPDSWKWVRLSELGTFSSGKTPDMTNHEFWDDGTVNWMTSKDMKQKFLTESSMKITESASRSMTVYQPGTLLMVVRSGILKRMLPLCILTQKSTINQDLKAYSLIDLTMSSYVYYMLKALEPNILFNYTKRVTTVDSLKFDEFSKQMPVPLPPLAEQKRIVAKIEQLLPICERLR